MGDGRTSEVVAFWGLPLARLDMAGAVDRVAALIEAGQPTQVITANLNFAMHCETSPRLRRIAAEAGMVTADGMPMVILSRLKGTPLPGRVTGSDLIFRLAERGAKEGWRFFFFGGVPGTADEASSILTRRFPGFIVAGVEVPPFRSLSANEHVEMVQRIRASRPDIILVAFGQPKGEFWLDDHLAHTGAKVGIQIGGTFELVSGKLSRAPKWVQKTGLEWIYRMAQEPRRLTGRYWANAMFLVRGVFGRAARMKVAASRPDSRG